MTDQRGRCKNTEYCSLAVAQKVVSVPDGAPPICPKCSETLELLQVSQRARRNRAVLALQAVVILAGGGAVAYKLLTGTSGDQTASGSAIVAGQTLAANADTSPALPTQAAPSAPALPVSGLPVQASPVQTLPVPAAAFPALPAPAPRGIELSPLAAMAVRPATPVQAASLVRLAGSDVMGAKLARRLASGYLALIGDSDITTQPGASANDIAIVGNQAGQHEAIGITQGGSAAGFMALLRGDADAAMSVRPPTNAEVEKLASVADLTNPANEHVLAVDGIVPVVSASNRIRAFSVAQLQGVLSGTVANWSALGRQVGGAVHAVVQDDRAGTLDTAARFVLGGASVASGVRRVASEAEVSSAVAGDPNAIGFVAFGHEGAARPVPVAAGTAAAVEATELTVSTEDYPLTRRLTLYTAATQGNTAARRFAEYAASPAGQAVVEAAGFVPLTVRQVAVPVPASASGRFRALVANATRVSVDFRFQAGSIELDSRSARDLDRLVTFLRTQHADGSRLILAGFADGQGSQQANQLVSQRRVDAVVAALARAGITPGRSAVFGAELPVADNATPEGRERNRRVEVYLLP